MNSVIEALWYGNISPFDSLVDGNDRFKELLALMAKNRDKIMETLTPELQTTLEAYDDNLHEMNVITELEAFRYGVRFGIQLMSEAFNPFDQCA
jgi:hypothetical protein